MHKSGGNRVSLLEKTASGFSGVDHQMFALHTNHVEPRVSLLSGEK